ncbi:MAG: V-type ATP synthase subunit B [Candidatus Latescibacterota bacterium]|nr:MAG: V-type ATP synthase subunit B [Candidatus Latescibacterota bacterium]RKY72516.1 MAG: V-type ATP synthase subunit B [Candidatus Latescibacterota bacterium]
MGISGIIYKGLSEITGPLIVLEDVKDVGYGELAEVVGPDGRTRRGIVLEVGERFAVVQVFQGTSGLSASETRVRFLGRPLQVRVSEEMLGRTFNGVGEPMDGGPQPLSGEVRDIHGSAINPASRDYPYDWVQTGISAVDGLNTLVRGQKLPLFSGSGLPHNRLAAQIVRQARISEEGEEFAVVFVGIGVKHDDARFFVESFERGGATQVATFLNLADDPPEERIVTPRIALTLAEYLAFERDFHVLVVMLDMTNYCEALRERASSRGEVPSRKGYPGYLYSDLASLYERCGRVKGRRGSITQLPILTMPNDDITHPVPDLTGYITEGQIVLDRGLHAKGIYPPINVLPSLSRIMKDAIGEGRTREDHPYLASQLYAAYSRVGRVRALATIVGEEELTALDRRYLEFGEAFEDRFINQGEEDRSLEETLEIGWEVVSLLPRSALYRVPSEILDRYYRG